MKESMTVEFKSDKNSLPMNDLYDTVVAMANSEGGTLYLGVEDNGKPTGLHLQHTNEVELSAKIAGHTMPPLYPHLRKEDWDGVTVLAIEIPSSHFLVGTSTGRYLYRHLKQDGSPENIPMQPMEIVQRLAYVQAVDPSALIIEDIPAKKAFSPLERERLRNMVRIYHGDSALLELSDKELDKALDFVREKNGEYYPTVAGLLMIGSEDYIRQYVPGNEVLFQVLDGTNVLYNPPAMRCSLLQIFEKCEMMFQSRITEQELSIGLFRVPIPNYEKDAFREGFVNALVHRDYFRIGTVHIQLLNNAMTIYSPGCFPEGVRPDNILTAAPRPRNKILAEAAKRIGLAERTGRGVDKIYTAMLRNGHDMPDYSKSDATSVMLRLNSSEVDEQFIRMLVTEEKRIDKVMPLDALIVLSALKNGRQMTIKQLAEQVQKDEPDTRDTVEWLVEIGMVHGIGSGKGRHYMLSGKVYALSGGEIAFTRQRGFTTIQEKEMILAHLDNFDKITRSEVMSLCLCTKNHAYWLLNELVKESKIQITGKGRYSYYKKADKSQR